MAQNLFTLDKIIRELLLKSGETSEHKYALYNVYACGYLNDFVNNKSREVRTVRLPMDTDRTVSLPPDFIDWAKVGTEHNGSVLPMSFNPLLSKLPSEEPVSAPMLNYIDADGTHCGELACTGYFNPGNDFTVDLERKIMRFGSTVSVGGIYLEYISSAIDLCGDTLIHPYCRPTLESYIKWKEAEFKKDSMLSYWRNEYYNEKRKLDASFNPFNIEMMRQIIISNFSQNRR